MPKKSAIKLFEDKKVRALWDSELEKWFISIVDVITVLTSSVNPTAYWRKLKQRLKAEGNETVTNYHGFKMKAPDGKMRMTDVANTELILNMLAEASTKDISEAANPETFGQSKKVAQQGGNVAKVARQELEAKTGEKAVTDLNANAILNKSNIDKKLKTRTISEIQLNFILN